MNRQMYWWNGDMIDLVANGVSIIAWAIIIASVVILSGCTSIERAVEIEQGYKITKRPEQPQDAQRAGTWIMDEYSVYSITTFLTKSNLLFTPPEAWCTIIAEETQ